MPGFAFAFGSQAAARSHPISVRRAAPHSGGYGGSSTREIKARRPRYALFAYEGRLSSRVGEEGFEPSHPRVFPDFVLEYAGWGGIPELGISCGHGNGRAPTAVKLRRPWAPGVARHGL